MLLALLRRFIRPYRWPIAGVVAAQILSTLAALSLPTINAALIDDGVARGDTAQIVRSGLLMLAVTVAQVVCAVTAVYFGARTALGLGRDLRSAVFTTVLTFSEHQTSRFSAASLLTRTTNDVGQIQALVQLTAGVAVTAPIMCIGGIAMALHQDAGLSWLLVLSVPVLAVGNYLIASRMLPVFRDMQRRIDGINRVLREELSGIRVVRAFAAEPLQQQRFAEANHAVADAALTAGRWQALMLPVTTLTINLSSVALIWFGGIGIDAGRMQVGSLFAFLAYFTQILMAVLMATLVLVTLPRAAVCAERITEVLDTRTAVGTSATPPGPVPAIRGEVALDHVSFRYPGAEQPTLDDVTFTARPGTTTAVVGGTGSGKSTLVGVICRLCEATGGTVRLDGADAGDLDPEYLWSALGLVPQRGYLFTGSVAENLRYGRDDATEAQMWDALRVAAAEDFVRSHPDGLDMRIAQGGVNLSGGQRQRLAIARAVIRRPAIYVFDDALSALDVHTDARVRTALRQASAESTVIIVAQRVSTILDADQIVVLDDGRVVGVGTHDRLMRECPQYIELAESQGAAAGAPR